MKKIILSLGLIFFSLIANAMDQAQQIPKLSHKTQLYGITPECTYRVDFVKQQESDKHSDKKTGEVKVVDLGIVEINLSFGGLRLSTLPRDNEDLKDFKDVAQAVIAQCNGFENNAKMLLTPLKMGYSTVAINVEEGTCHDLRNELGRK